MSLDDKCSFVRKTEWGHVQYCGNKDEPCQFRSQYVFRYYNVNQWPKAKMLYRCKMKEEGNGPVL